MREEKYIEEYRLLNDHLNSSLLSSYSQSPGHALLPVVETAAMNFGTMWHLFIQQYFLNNSCFDSRYFIVEDLGPMPDGFMSWLDDEVIDIKDRCRYTKTGTLDGRFKNLHAWIEIASENTGKLPCSGDDYYRLESMLKGFLACEYNEMQMSEFLKGSSFEKAFTWETGDIKNRCLFDSIVGASVNGEGTKFAIDFKSTRSLDSFQSSFNKRYWIQDCHYSEGFQHYNKSLQCTDYAFDRMLFIVTESEEPFQTQIMTASDDDISQMRDDYLKLRYECWEWLQDGKPNPGWLPQKTLKYWRKDGK